MAQQASKRSKSKSKSKHQKQSKPTDYKPRDFEAPHWCDNMNPRIKKIAECYKGCFTEAEYKQGNEHVCDPNQEGIIKFSRRLEGASRHDAQKRTCGKSGLFHGGHKDKCYEDCYPTYCIGTTDNNALSAKACRSNWYDCNDRQAFVSFTACTRDDMFWEDPDDVSRELGQQICDVSYPYPGKDGSFPKLKYKGLALCNGNGGQMKRAYRPVCYIDPNDAVQTAQQAGDRRARERALFPNAVAYYNQHNKLPDHFLNVERRREFIKWLERELNKPIADDKKSKMRKYLKYLKDLEMGLKPAPIDEHDEKADPPVLKSQVSTNLDDLMKQNSKKNVGGNGGPKALQEYYDRMNGFDGDYNNNNGEVQQINGFIPNVAYPGTAQAYIVPNPNIVSPVNYGYNNQHDNLLIGVVAILLAVLICLICVGMSSLLGIGCYMFGKSQGNNRDNDESDKDTPYQELV